MSNPVFVSRTWLKLAAYFVVAAVLLKVIYVVQLQYTNAYLGYQPFTGALDQVLTSSAMVIAVVCLVPYRISRPSDFFVLFYSVVVLMSCGLSSQVTGVIDAAQSVALFLTLLIPVFVVLALRSVAVKVPPAISLPPAIVYGVALVLVGAAFAYGYSKGGGGGFDWSAMYERRLEGRDVFEARSAGAYLLSMAINGLTPFVAFVGGARKNISLMALGLGMGCFAFWLLGLKAPFAMALLFAALGRLVHSGRMDKVPRFIALAILGVCALTFLEMIFFEHSLIAEVIVRRAFVVQGELQSYYWDIIGNSFSTGIDSFLFGRDFSAYEGVTFFVGSEYQGDPLANANSNAFLVAFASNGLFGFIAAVLFVGIYCSVMDALYRSSGRPEVFLVVALYSLLVTEQSYTVAFVSSGIGLLTMLVFAIGRGGRSPTPAPASSRLQHE